MTALSRAHLEAAGYAVELLCYPDTPDGSSWLWGSALNEIETEGIAQLVVIGDRPDPTGTRRYEPSGTMANERRAHQHPESA